MKSKALQSTETLTEIARLFARLALGASFLSAVADRFGFMGTLRGKERILGKFCSFCGVHALRDGALPSSLTQSLAWASTIGETLFGGLLIVGFKIRVTSVLSGFLLLLFAIGMATGLGVKTPFDYSVFSGGQLRHFYWHSGSLTGPPGQSLESVHEAKRA